MPDLSEGTSRDADGDGVPDFRDPRVNCSHNFPGQQWADIQHASTVHAVSCMDTVANGHSDCHLWPSMSPSDFVVKSEACASKMKRFHGNVGDSYTIQCPSNCDQEQSSIVYGPGNGNSFLDHSSICRAAIAKGVLVGPAGLVVIRLVEPIASYPANPSMPFSSGAQIARPLSTQRVNGWAFSWPEWNRADDNTSVAEFGPPSACCNYSTSVASVTQTPEGGGCCAIQRFRQKWIPKLNQNEWEEQLGDYGSSLGIGNFWVGVRAFEILNDTYQAGCPVFVRQDECNSQVDCVFDHSCGCIAKGGSCASPCSVANFSRKEAETLSDDVCVDRCLAEPKPGKVVIEVIRNETGLETGRSPAFFTVALDRKPMENVYLLIGTKPSDLLLETNNVLTFTASNYSEPQDVLLSGFACAPDQPISSTSDVSIATASEDGSFHDLTVRDVSISITAPDRCPILQYPPNAEILSSNYKYTSVVFVLNYYCRLYYEYRDRDSSQAQFYLQMCGKQDCRQIEEIGCKYTDANGFCYTTCGIAYCDSNPSDARCHVHVPALHGQCQEARNIVNQTRSWRIVCGQDVGSTCTVRCAVGFQPLEQAILTCQPNGNWDRSMPACNICAPGYFATESGTCQKCNDAPCTVGFFRGTCTSMKDAHCVPCSGKPADSVYDGTGNPYTADACPWSCKPGFYRTGDSCMACSNGSCGPGQYRQACKQTSDAQCVPCSAVKPKNSSWSTGGMPFDRDNCQWRCDQGYFLDASRIPICHATSSGSNPYEEITIANSALNAHLHHQRARDIIPAPDEGCPSTVVADPPMVTLPYVGRCLPIIAPAIVVQTPSCAGSSLSTCLAEAGGTATLKFKLSTKPVSSVLIALTHDSQLNASTRYINISASDWNVEVEAVVSAYDDRNHEGPHFGVLYFEVVSDDPAYHVLPTSPVSFGIADNDCPRLSAPLHGSLEACANTHGDTCTIVCDAGHAPSAAVQMQCVAATSQWDRSPPTCDRCLAMHYRSGSNCRPCSTSPCGDGRVRGNCTVESDSTCVPCVVDKPLHSAWLEDCTWRCERGYSELNGTCTPLPVPRLVIQHPLPAASESVHTSVQILLQISKQPTAPVTISVHSTDGQLNITPSSLPAFNPADWLQGRNISIVAVDDSVVEGPHSGMILITLSSSDDEWHNRAANVSIRIADNDCHAFKEPQNGRIVSCRHTYGDLCTFQCNSGFSPRGNISSRCLASGTWSSVPACDFCASNFFRDGSECLACSTGLCPVGFFRSQCLINQDSTCVPCSSNSRPQNSRFVTAGIPEFADACRWDCDVGFFQSSSACVPCTTSPCRAGFYRETCSRLSRTTDAKCEPCNTSLPAGAIWIAARNLSDGIVSHGNTKDSTCGWMCDNGFRKVSGACISQGSPYVIVAGPIPGAVKEAEPSTPAVVSFKLSEAPISNVTLILNVTVQLNIITAWRLVFTPANWNESQTVLVVPIDDAVREGDHVGILIIQSVISSDTRYHEVESPPVSVDIEDNDCEALLPPNDGALSSCNTVYGQTCTATCNLGFDPAGPVVLLCLGTGRWNSSVPSCTRCADTYFIDSEGGCTRCSREPCSEIGTFRSMCQTRADSTCAPCSGNPLNSHFTSSAEPFDLDSCPWACDAGFYKSSGVCKACTTAPCDTGQYRSACVTNADSVCLPCSNTLPDNSHFVSDGGILSGGCAWACDQGFERTANSSACVLLYGPQLLITEIRMRTSEHDLNFSADEPSIFNISLSPKRIPVGDVIANLSPSAQLRECSPIFVVFNTTWIGPVTVTCYALADAVPEGPHSGTVAVSLASAVDNEYASLPTAKVQIAISEDLCLALANADGYQVLNCTRTINGLCYLRCRAGFEPQTPAVLQCTRDSSRLPVWSGQVPTCSKCLSGYYRKGIECLKCIWTCPIGQYRSACVSEVGAVCSNCTNSIPANAEYITAGIPVDSNACTWACRSGFTLNSAASMCLAPTTTAVAPSTTPTSSTTAAPAATPAPAISSKPRLVFTIPSSVTSEEPGTSPALFMVSLSDAPATTISFAVSWSTSQLHAPSMSQLVFTPETWATPASLSVAAMYDGLSEGFHSGWVSLNPSAGSRRVQVELDSRFVDVSANLTVAIIDYNCPDLPLPLNGELSCTETSAEKQCRVICNTGYSLDYSSFELDGSVSNVSTGTSADCQICALMQCDKSSLTWDKEVPHCSICAAGSYKSADGACLRCSTVSCPVGQYRGPCALHSDAVCRECTNQKPSHSFYTTSGIPYNVDNCSWACDAGRLLERVLMADGNETEMCTQLPSPERRDPADTDQDGIPDTVEGDDQTDTDHDGTPDYLDLDRFLHTLIYTTMHTMRHTRAHARLR